jgi:ABC-type Fe3+-hydroxamate transport system substrate-binding protein
LHELGLEEEVVGITRFCVHPRRWLKEKIRVGGTKDLKIDLIQSLNPGLVLANREENTREQVERIREFCPVWTSDIKDIDDALAMIRSVGQLVGRIPEADALESRIRSAFQDLPPAVLISCIYLIWKKPYMGAGGDTFISHMMQRAGFRNLLATERRYPTLSETDIKNLEPEVLLLSSEPYPFREKHIADMQALLPKTRILLADGEMFSWYGSRMQWAAAYFRRLYQEAGKPPGANGPFRH